MPLKSFLGQKTVANKLFAELYQILSFSSFKVPGYLSFENTGLDLFFFSSVTLNFSIPHKTLNF